MQEGIYHDNFEGHRHPLEAENKDLRAQLAESERRRVELVEAVRPVVRYYDALGISNMDAFKPSNIIMGTNETPVTKAQLDALAALVGRKGNER